MINILTVEQANEIQNRWMALSFDDSEEIINQVFKDMKKTPKRYLSVNRSIDKAVVMFDGSPLNQQMDIDEAIAKAENLGVQTELWWQNSKWIDGK